MSIFKSLSLALGFSHSTTADDISSDISEAKFCVGDSVMFKSALGAPKRGLIKFIGGVFSLGPIEKNTVHYGIECEEQLAGGNDGTASKAFGRQLFRCEKRCGVLVLRNQIVQIVKQSKNESRITVNDVIKHCKRGFGVVKFIGSVTGTEGVWFGIELFDRKGQHDGCFKDEVYFECETSYGILARMRDIAAPTAYELKSKIVTTGLTNVRMLDFEAESEVIYAEPDEEKDGPPTSDEMGPTRPAGGAKSIGPGTDGSGLTVFGDGYSSAPSKGLDILGGDIAEQRMRAREERMRKKEMDEQKRSGSRRGSKGTSKAYGTSDTQKGTRPKSRGASDPTGASTRYGTLVSRTDGAKTTTKAARRFKDHYDCDTVSDHLGDGSFGSVFKCYSKSLKIGKHRRKYAMKRISKVTIMKMDDTATKEELLMRIRDEIRHLRKMRREKGKLLPGYRNVMHFVDAFEEPGFLYIITNFCNGGTLYDYCLAHDTGLTEKQCQKVFKDVLLGLRFMKNYDIAHLNLNPSNIMLVKHPKTGEEIFQLIDFGMARVIPRMRKVSGHTVGTPHFIAPEVLNGEYNPLSDMWSVGVILFLLLFGYPPFFDTDPRGNDAVIFRLIKRGFDTESWLNRKSGQGNWIPSDYRVHRSDQVCELICRCLRLDLAKRIVVDDALDHKWLRTEATDKELPHGMHNALLTFTKQCKFRVLMSRMFTAELTAEERKKVRDVFKALDADGNGKVSREEFIQGMTDFKLGYDEASLSEMFDSVDINSDGNLDLSELMTAFSYQRMAATDARLEEIFKELDEDGTGFITRDALAEKWEDLKDKRRADEMKSSKISKLGVADDTKLSELDIAADRSVDGMIWGRESVVARMSDLELVQLDAELDERITNAIAFADLDGDGRISKEEFMASLHPELHESSTLARRAYQPSPTTTATFTFMRATSTTLTRAPVESSKTGETDPLGAGDYSDEDEYYDDEFDLGETTSEDESGSGSGSEFE